jgi:hypothetical protein
MAETKTEQNGFKELYAQVKTALNHYCDSAKGEKIVIDEAPETGDFAIFSIWSEQYDQDQVEEAKLKISSEKLQPEHRQLLEKEGFVWDETIRAWVY